MQICAEPNCGKEFKNNSGLASHMYMAHRKKRTGEAIPEKVIEQRITKLSDSQYERFKELRAKGDKKESPTWQPTEKGEAHYKKLAAEGIFRCPECATTRHKSVDFPSAKELGKHRRFRHGVLGRNTLLKMRNEARRSKASAKETTTIAATPETTENEFNCPHCEKTGFRNAKGLAMHIGRKHKGVDELPQPKELIHVNGSPQGTTYINGHDAAAIHHRSTAGQHDAAFITTIAVSNIRIQFESIIAATSLEYDLPPRELARRSLLHLSKRYSEER